MMENVFSQGFHPNHRGLSVCFGEDMVENFCKQHNVDLIVRGHQVRLSKASTGFSQLLTM